MAMHACGHADQAVLHANTCAHAGRFGRHRMLWAAMHDAFPHAKALLYLARTDPPRYYCIRASSECIKATRIDQSRSPGHT